MKNKIWSGHMVLPIQIARRPMFLEKKTSHAHPWLLPRSALRVFGKLILRRTIFFWNVYAEPSLLNKGSSLRLFYNKEKKRSCFKYRLWLKFIYFFINSKCQREKKISLSERAIGGHSSKNRKYPSCTPYLVLPMIAYE